MKGLDRLKKEINNITGGYDLLSFQFAIQCFKEELEKDIKECEDMTNKIGCLACNYAKTLLKILEEIENVAG